jgi:hypothetical protein
MKTCPILIIVVLVSNLPCAADFIFNVDFEDPPQIVNQQVVIGSAINLPTYGESTVMIRTNIGDFTTQAASLEPAGAMGFFYAPSVTTGHVRLSWDLTLIDHGPGTGFESAAIGILSSGPGGLNIFYQKDAIITLNGMNIGSFTTGVSDHYDFLLNLNNDSYAVFMNGATVLYNESLFADFALQNVVFSRDSDEFPSYAVDNFQWEVIPEPSTMILLLVGATGLITARLRRS